MKLFLSVICLVLCVAAVKKRTYYDVTCPECKVLYHHLECLKELNSGGYTVTNGVMQQVQLQFKCPARHKFTSYTERFVETLPPAIESK